MNIFLTLFLVQTLKVARFFFTESKLLKFGNIFFSVYLEILKVSQTLKKTLVHQSQIWFTFSTTTFGHVL